MSDLYDMGMDQFKQYARDWAAKVVNLYHTPVYNATDQREKDALISRAKDLKAKVESFTGAIDALKPLDEIGLGFSPVLITGAVSIASLVAAMVYWNSDYGKAQLRFQQREALINGGMTPAQADATLRGEKDNGGYWMLGAVLLGMFLMRSKR